MLTDLQEAWLRELETGSRPQGQGCLKSQNGFCCLGVFADMEGALVEFKGMFGPRWVIPSGEDFETAILPKELADKLGLVNNAQGDLAVMNDMMDMSFKDIAARVRANPEAYFVHHEPR